MGGDCLDVLVADDQPGVRYLLDIIIKEAGHRVHMAGNGLEALEMVRRIRPQLVFMDVRMPLMDGLEALGRIKKLSPETEVVMMTAYFSDDTIARSLKKGAVRCLAKPFDVEKIKALIKEFTWQQRNKEQLLAGAYVII
ncbi:response regulator [Desulfotomaculum copahuensis]|uniref:Stage 0 sporulation protein A homolog n=1 Tax=Desulfotomaculum copahuensis TaxID=1838280 RepID=A0A1B7LBW5_9FIRM|nr:response regulator [Desulfotomaculum copahuensis]OAT79963.1 histidine kinase [Desulfotomaculum copahuensis]